MLDRKSILCIFIFCAASWASLLTHAQTPEFIKAKLQEIDFANPLLIPIYSCQVDEIEQLLPAFYKHYPENITADIRKTFEQKKKTADEQYGYIDDFLFIHAKHLLVSGDTAGAWMYLAKSLQYNPLNMSSVSLQTQLYLHKGQLDSAALHLIPVIHIFAYNDRVQSLTQDIYQRLCDSTSGMIRQRLYNEAMHYYQIADTFNSANPLLRKNDDKQKRCLKEIHQGIYQSILDIAYKAYAEKKWKLSEHFALRAWDYGVENKDELLDRLNIDVLLTQIMAEYDRQASSKNQYQAKIDFIKQKTGLNYLRLSSNERLAERVNSSNETTKTAPSIGEVNHVPVFDPSAHTNTIIKEKVSSPAKRRKIQEEYNQCVENSRLGLYQNNIPLAKAYLEHAENLWSVYTFVKRDTDLDSIKYTIQKEEISALFDQASYLLFLGNEIQADSVFLEGLELIDSYQVERLSPEISSHIQDKAGKYLKALKQSKCEALENVIKQHLTKAESLCREYQYLQAQTFLQNGMQLPDSLNCRPDLSALQIKSKEIKPAADYQALSDAAENQRFRKDTFLFFETYHQMELFAKQHALADFRLRHVSLWDKYAYEKNTDMLIKAATYYINQKYCEDAGHCLKALDAAGLKNKSTRKLHKMLKTCATQNK